MSIDSVLTLLNKKYPDTVYRLSDCEDRLRVRKFSTGSVALDLLLRGGFPFGRIVELYGPEGSFKSTLAMIAAKAFLSDPAFANVSPKNVYVVWTDLEKAMTYSWALSMGIPADRMLLFLPEKGEQVFDGLYAALTSDPDDHILWITDSIAELSKEGELENEMEDYTTVGAQAQLISSGIRRRILPALRKSWLRPGSGNTIMHINQARDRMATYGPVGGIDAPGGRHRRHANSVTVECRVVSTKNRKVQRNNIKFDETYAYELKWTIRKNKCGGPDAVSATTMFFSQKVTDADGIEREAGKFGNDSSLLDYAVYYGAVEISTGHVYSFKGNELGRGRGSALRAIQSDRSLAQDIYSTTLLLLQSGDLGFSPQKVAPHAPTSSAIKRSSARASKPAVSSPPRRAGRAAA